MSARQAKNNPIEVVLQSALKSQPINALADNFEVENKVETDINVEVNKDIKEDIESDSKVETDGDASSEVDRIASLKAKMKEGRRKESNKQVTVYLTPENYKRFNKFKAKGEKSELINQLLDMYFED